MASPSLHQRDFLRTTVQPRHRTLLPKLAEAYLADDAPMDPKELEAFCGEVDQAISMASKTLRFGLIAMLDVVQWSPLFILGKPSFFEDLSLHDRARLLERLERSKLVSLTLVFVAWKTDLGSWWVRVRTERPGRAGAFPPPRCGTSPHTQRVLGWRCSSVTLLASPGGSTPLDLS